MGLIVVLLIPRDMYGEEAANNFYTESWALLHLLALFAFLSLRQHSPRALAIAVVFIIYILSSAVWSVNPKESLISAVFLGCNVIVAYTAATDLGRDRLIRLVAQVSITLVIAGLLAFVLDVEAVVYYDAHERLNYLGTEPLRGFFTHKIVGSLYAIIGMIAAFSAFKGLLRIVSCVATVVFVLLTGSATGLALLLIAFPVTLIIHWLRRKQVRLAVLLGTSLPLIAIIPIILIPRQGSILQALGRDENLTGRTDLWDAGIRSWSERPILGWGYDAYLNSEEWWWIRTAYEGFRNYEIPSFHNSFIQTAVDLGLVGLLALTCVIFSVLRSSAHWAVSGETSSGSAMLGIIAVCLVASPFMFLFFSVNHPVTILLVSFFFLSLEKVPNYGDVSFEVHAKRNRFV